SSIVKLGNLLDGGAAVFARLSQVELAGRDQPAVDAVRRDLLGDANGRAQDVAIFGRPDAFAHGCNRRSAEAAEEESLGFSVPMWVERGAQLGLKSPSLAETGLQPQRLVPFPDRVAAPEPAKVNLGQLLMNPRDFGPCTPFAH